MTQAKTQVSRDQEYGVLGSRNIDRVTFGDYTFNAWYGNGAYFLNHGDSELGISKTTVSRKRSTSSLPGQYWLDNLYVCQFCFKYTSDQKCFTAHRVLCSHDTAYPKVGQLVYADMKASILIKRIQGYKNELFCQNMALFSKLFLDDKSVYYNVDAFDFYVLYGQDTTKPEEYGTPFRRRFEPMGFFSKEVNSWDKDNNLACICVFPPYQRLHLGSLLIEFSFALASVTPGQARLGPELPLSPFGKVAYLNYWSKRLVFCLLNSFKELSEVLLKDLANETGFRKDDILFALEHMGVLYLLGNSVTFSPKDLLQWAETHRFNPRILPSMLNPDALVI